METQLYQKRAKQVVQCTCCARRCLIAPNKTGFCGVRQNRGGKLYLTVFGKPVGLQVDPIEKKPLFHFLPGSQVLSFGTFGCNLACKFCQNFELSQCPKEQSSAKFAQTLASLATWSPEKIVQYCKCAKIPTIAFTYNEPTIFAEYFLPIARLAQQAKIKTVLVSNGFFSAECFALFRNVIDAINLDLKGFTAEFYREICGLKLSPTVQPDCTNLPIKYQNLGELSCILSNIAKCQQAGIWTEVTTLIIPGYNDQGATLRNCAEFLAWLSPAIPWHLSAFYPAYQMLQTPRTPAATLYQAAEIGRAAGLEFVFTGNILKGAENTLCPQCQINLIERQNFTVLANNLVNGHCPNCRQKIAGVWA